MHRVDYIRLRLRQLRAENLFPTGFSAWLCRLELGELPSGSHRLALGFARMVDLVVAEIRERSAPSA